MITSSRLGAPGPATNDKATDAAIAQYNAMRAEIVGYQNSQAALVGVGLTAVGVIYGLVLKDGTNTRLLLAVPFLCLFIAALHASYNYRMARRGDYIRFDLWPQVQTFTGSTVRSWEQMFHRSRWSRGAVVADLFVESGLTLMLTTLAAVSTAFVWAGIPQGPRAVAVGASALVLLVQPAVLWLNYFRSRQWSRRDAAEASSCG